MQKVFVFPTIVLLAVITTVQAACLFPPDVNGLVTIPAMYNKAPFTELQNEAFKDCTDLKVLDFELPSKLEAIGNSVFSGCTALTTVTNVPPTISVIPSMSFMGCSALKSFNMAPGKTNLKTIDTSAFSGCGKLTEFNVASSVTSINDNAFQNCVSMTAINFPQLSSLAIIGKQAFKGCSALTKFIVPQPLYFIDDNAFYGCVSLGTFTFNCASTGGQIDNNVFGNDASGTVIPIMQSTYTLKLPAHWSIGTNSPKTEPLTACALCTSGQYSDTGNTNVVGDQCTSCPAGKYNGWAGNDVCYDCPAGKYSAATGANNIGTCMGCNAGYYSINTETGSTTNSICTACAKGKYSSFWGAATEATCTLCPDGTYSSAVASTVCTKASAGKFAKADHSGWESCPAGTWNGPGAQTQCTNCQAGSYSTTVGAVRETICSACSAGSTSPEASTAKAQCVLCKSGEYGFLVTNPNLAQCALCIADTYSATPGVQKCTACPSGKSSGIKGATDEKVCVATGFFGSTFSTSGGNATGGIVAGILSFLALVGGFGYYKMVYLPKQKKAAASETIANAKAEAEKNRKDLGTVENTNNPMNSA